MTDIEKETLIGENLDSVIKGLDTFADNFRKFGTCFPDYEYLEEEVNKNKEEQTMTQEDILRDTIRREAILEDAKQRISEQKEQDYGSPEDNFELIAKLWNAYLYSNCDVKLPAAEAVKLAILPSDVAMMMALLKIARIRTGVGTVDSFVDLAGYAACGGALKENEG